jgi:hypothetical protein
VTVGVSVSVGVPLGVNVDDGANVSGKVVNKGTRGVGCTMTRVSMTSTETGEDVGTGVEIEGNNNGPSIGQSATGATIPLIIVIITAAS